MFFWKKVIACAVAVAMLLSFAACDVVPPQTSDKESTPPETSEVVSESPTVPEDTGKVYNIYCWNEEFQTRFKKFFEDAGLVPEGVKINWVITPSDGGAYQQKLDEALSAQATAADDDKVDLFLIEADYALKYINSPTPVAMDVYGDVGLTEADTADMYQYTKDICTDASGNLRGLSWQACPGGLIYRRSIAKAVLGTDDPAAVQEALSTWEKFDAVAADAKSKGYYMTSSFVANYRVFSNNVSAPWVNGNDEIVFDPAVKQWITQANDYLDKGYTLPYGIWDAESFNEAKVDGKAMCYFGPGWFFDFCLMPATLADSEAPAEPGNGSYGDWGLVKGPQGFFWGGTWLCAAVGSDNVNLTREIMKKMTCDKDTLVEITNEYADFTNNAKAMEELAADSTYGHPFLGGQNHIAVLLDSAKSIDMSNISMYDQLLNEGIAAAFKDYFLGNITEEQAYDNFYTSAITSYPNLKRPA